MSGLFVALGDRSQAEKAAELLAFTPDTRRFVEIIDSLAIAVTRVDSPELWSPARDAQTGVFVALGGRLAFDEPEWAAGEKLPHAGGLACRIVLNRFLRDPDMLAAGLNGSGLVLIFDPRHHQLHVITDRLGVFPMFERDANEPCLCSHADVLAQIMEGRGQRTEFDPLTAAEFLSTGTSVQPFSYYRQIRMLEPASHYRWTWDGDQWKRTLTTYWQPRYLTEKPSHNEDELTALLAEAFGRAVKRRTLSRLGTPGVLLSGGADSRVAVFGAADPAKMRCFTLFDEPNEELATARRIATAAGAQHTALQRDPDYYARNAEESVRISGGMWSLLDTHYTGMIPKLREQHLGTVLTGCYTDYVLKGLSFNRQHRRLFGRALPLYDFAPFDFSFYADRLPLAPAWEQKVLSRLDQRYPQTVRNGEETTRLALADLRLRPLAREADAASRAILWRTLPWDPPIADSDVLEVFGRMSAESKLNGIIFGRAVARICGRPGRRIPNNNYGTPVGASQKERAIWFLWAVAKRKARRALGIARKHGSAVTTGSWPDWGVYFTHSPTVARWWADVNAAERHLFTDWLGEDPWKLSQAECAQRDVIRMARILTLKLWLRQRGTF